MKKVYLSTAMMFLSSSLVLGAADSDARTQRSEEERTTRVMEAIAGTPSENAQNWAIDQMEVDMQIFYTGLGAQNGSMRIRLGDTWNDMFRLARLNPNECAIIVDQIERTNMDEMIPFDVFRKFQTNNPGFTKFFPKQKPAVTPKWDASRVFDYGIDADLSQDQGALIRIDLNEAENRMADGRIESAIRMLDRVAIQLEAVGPDFGSTEACAALWRRLETLRERLNPVLSDPVLEIPSISLVPQEEVAPVIQQSISNIDNVYNVANNIEGEKLVVLDMDECLLGRFDESRARKLLNPSLPEMIGAMVAQGAHVIIVSQSAQSEIEDRLNTALMLAGKTQRARGLFAALLCSQNSPSKADVIRDYLRTMPTRPNAILFADDTKEHLDVAGRALANLNIPLHLFHFTDPRIAEFTTVEQAQAMLGGVEYAAARAHVMAQGGVAAYRARYAQEEQQVIHGVAGGASSSSAPTQSVYRSVYGSLGITSDEAARLALRELFGLLPTDASQDPDLLRQYLQML